MHRHMRWWSHAGTAHAFGLAGCGSGSCGDEREERRGPEGWQTMWAFGLDAGDLGAGAFGVRRPLRFLAHKLELDDEQMAELATILDDLKTERAQAEVDGRRATAALADAVAGDRFDTERLAEGGATRVRSAERVRDAVGHALGRIHALLRPEQRRRLAYLIRTGILRI